MTNWQTFKVLGVERYQTGGTSFSSGYSIKLDKYVEFSDEYKKSVNVGSLGERINSYGISCGRFEKPYIDIDIDKTKRMKKFDEIPNDAWRIVPNEVISERNRREMTKVSSADPTTLAVVREGFDRVDRDNQTEFKQEVVDTRGNKHNFTYRKY